MSAAVKSKKRRVKDVPKSNLGTRAPTMPSGVSQSLARILRPQASYRWLMPMLGSITPQYIEMVLRGALAGNHVQQWELFDLMLDTWPELSACAQELQDAVASMRLTFSPFAEEDEEPAPEAVERCKLTSSALRRMAPDAAADENDLQGTLNDIIDGWFRGVTCLEIDWQTIASPAHGTILAPRCTFWVHPVCFAWDINGRLGLRVDAQGQMSPASLGIPVQGQPSVVGAFPPHKFLIGIHKAKRGTALGGSMLRPLAWWWCAANFSADWVLNLAQLFGIPFRWVTYDPNAAVETVDRICQMLQDMGESGYSAFPDGTTLNFLEAGKQGSDHSPQGELLDRADRYARLVILGQTMSGSQDASKGGGKAFGEVESDVKARRVAAAAKYVCSVLNGQLIPSVLALNYGDADLCPQAQLLPDTKAGLERAQTLQVLGSLGLELSKSELRAAFELTAPVDEEDTIGGGSDQSSVISDQDSRGDAENAEDEPLESRDVSGEPRDSDGRWTFSSRVTVTEGHWAHQEGEIDGLPWSSAPARYAKGNIALKAPGKAGFKARGATLADALNARWSNRERAYILSESKFKKWQRLALHGYDGNFLGELTHPTGDPLGILKKDEALASRLAVLADIEDDAVFARELEALVCGYDSSEPRDDIGQWVADPSKGIIHPDEARKQLDDGIHLVDPLKYNATLDARVLDHWEAEGHSIENQERRLRRLPDVVETIENPHEIWQQPNQRAYLRAFVDDISKRRYTAGFIVQDGRARTFFHEQRKSAIQKFRNGERIYVRP